MMVTAPGRVRETWPGELFTQTECRTMNEVAEGFKLFLGVAVLALTLGILIVTLHARAGSLRMQRPRHDD